MKILTKLNLFSFTTVVTVAVLMVLSGTLVINDIVYDLNSRVIALELGNVYSMVEEHYEVLKKHKLLGVEDYVKSAQQEVADSLKQYRRGKTDCVYIVAKDGTVVSHTHIDSSEKIELPKLSEMLASKQGNIEYVFQGEERFCMYNTFPGWDWLIAVSITKKEMFSKRAQYFRQVSVIGLVVAILILIGGVFFSRSIADRINSTLNCVKAVETGDLTFRIPEPTSSDEIGILQKGVNQMVSTIQTRNQKQHKAEEALRESEEKYRVITNSALDAIIEIDPDGKVTHWNPATQKMFGYTKDEIMGKDVHDYLMPKKFREQYEIGFEKFRKTGTGPAVGQVFELKAIHKDGHEFPIEIAVSPIEKQGQNWASTIIRNITKRKQAEEEKARLEAQLQQSQKMEAIGTLAGGIAHDFNNLLMGIQGRASLMLMDTSTTHPHCEHLQEIEDYVKSAADLTKQLLGFARGGKYEVRSTDLNELIKNQNRMFGRTKKEITIRGKYEKDLWVAEVDQGQVEQVLLNLYVNAWQSMPGGGDLYIQTENIILDENYTMPFEVKPGKYVKISVTDTGVGMDEATRQRIFDPFFTTKEIGRSTGLGLATVYGIIKNHEGFINVYSEKGEGATFNIYLPTSEKEVIEEKELAKDVLKGTETVLLVDDENVIIYAVERFLKEMGYKTLIARSGKETVKIYKKNKDKIDVVILDMIMPEMGGGETYDRLKEINPDIKVLLSSGYSLNDRATKILERGCNGFIQKPYRSRGLSQKIREILDKD